MNWSTVAKAIRDAIPTVDTVDKRELLGDLILAMDPGALVTATVWVPGEVPHVRQDDR